VGSFVEERFLLLKLRRKTMVNKEDVEWTWNHAQEIRGKNSDLYRRDEDGNQIYKPSYGKNGEQSWEVDHRNPVAKGGSDHRRNLRALQTAANRKKGDKY
jgi:5-methylcytosine-specific restriction endonuclease McrA